MYRSAATFPVSTYQTAQTAVLGRPYLPVITGLRRSKRRMATIFRHLGFIGVGCFPRRTCREAPRPAVAFGPHRLNRCDT